MDILIKKVYQCGNSMGVVFLDEDCNRVSRLVGKWDWELADDGMKYDGVCRGRAARELYSVVEGAIKKQRQQSATPQPKAQPKRAATEDRATRRQVNYAQDLVRRIDGGEWVATFGGQWFNRKPSREQIANMSKTKCSRFISDLKGPRY